jgi:hypothetical protein
MTFDFTDEQLKGFPPEAQAIIRALAAEVKRLNARVAELEARLSKTPKNSSLRPVPSIRMPSLCRRSQNPSASGAASRDIRNTNVN